MYIYHSNGDDNVLMLMSVDDTGYILMVWIYHGDDYEKAMILMMAVAT